MNNHFKIDGHLKKLSSIFAPYKLYAVGGYARNYLMGLPSKDLDLCGPAHPGEIAYAGKKHLGVTIAPINPRIGTLKIIYGGRTYEYTTFRRDNYEPASGHTPCDAVFTKSLEEDALRRDFTVNAIYCDISTDGLIDPLNGAADLERRILRTCDCPGKTLSEDGLRLMRLARFAAEYGFGIDDATKKAATENASLIMRISGERIRDELLKILNSENQGPAVGLNLLAEIGVLRYILPELDDCRDLKRRSFGNGELYDVFEHIVNTVLLAEKRIRLAALLHDAGKPECIRKDGNAIRHAAVGEALAAARLGQSGLKLPAKTVSRVRSLIKNHMFDSDGKIPENEIRLFLQRNHHIAADLIALKKADYFSKCPLEEASEKQTEYPRSLKIKLVYDEMTALGIPLSLSDLKVTGNDLYFLGFRGTEIGKALNLLLTECANNFSLSTKEAQLEFIKALNEHPGDL